MRPVTVMSMVFLTTMSLFAQATDRLPTIPPVQYSDDQKQAAADFEAARKVPVFGPFEPLMHSPQIMSQARSMGDYLRYKSALGNTLSELAILIAAREWSQDYEWYVHQPIALKGDHAPVGDRNACCGILLFHGRLLAQGSQGREETQR